MLSSCFTNLICLMPDLRQLKLAHKWSVSLNNDCTHCNGSDPARSAQVESSKPTPHSHVFLVVAVCSNHSKRRTKYCKSVRMSVCYLPGSTGCKLSIEKWWNKHFKPVNVRLDWRISYLNINVVFLFSSKKRKCRPVYLDTASYRARYLRIVKAYWLSWA